MSNKYGVSLILITVLLLLIVIPSSTAYEFESGENVTLCANEESIAFYESENDVYFDASAPGGGNGSKSNPYNELKQQYIKNNAIVHLAEGEYFLDTHISAQYNNLTVYGAGMKKTTVTSHHALTIKHFILSDLTLSGVNIINHGTINITNVCIEDAKASIIDHYNNSFGGAIYNPGEHYDPYLYLTNCVFKNNFAEYGGAIYMTHGHLKVVNSTFESNTAYNYGGAIAAGDNSKIDIFDSIFINDRSLHDSGGAIYFKLANVTINNSKFSNCYAQFGGAVCDLNSNTRIYDTRFSNNNASYRGGAIYSLYGTLFVKNGQFTRNHAKNGGAVFLDNATSHNIGSSLFISNTADVSGGAIYSILNKIPENTENTYYNNKASNGDNVYQTQEINLWLGNGNYTLLVNNDIHKDITSLPAYYSLVDDNLVTPVKNQQSTGDCWAFSSIAALESCILKTSGVSYDLSEENMKNLIGLYSDYGWNVDTNREGYDSMAIGYLTSWLGPVFESEDPFDDHSTLSPVLHSRFHVQDVLFLGRQSYLDNDAIKKAILKFGGVVTGMHNDDHYLNSANAAYYYDGEYRTNHAIVIVGWDDDYSRYNFKNTPQGNGAWICRNSWGEDYGKNGYFYVSYYDTKVAEIKDVYSSYTFILNNTVDLDKNYQHCVIGVTNFLVTGRDTVWYKNVFNATDNELLAAFSTYFNNFVDWQAQIYVNNELKYTQSGHSDPGYYTFKLNKFIPLHVGDIFEVVLRITADSFVNIPISGSEYTNKAIYKKGMSYLSFDGNEWEDLCDFKLSYLSDTYPSQVACIKAFTTLDTLDTFIFLNDYEVKVGEKFNIEANVLDAHNHRVTTGNVTFFVNGKNFIVNVNDGKAALNYAFSKEGNYTVKATYNGFHYNPCDTTSTVNVKDSLLGSKILLSFDSPRVNEDVLITATVYDSNNNLINEGTVTFNSNGKGRTVNVNNGKATFTMTYDSAGAHVIDATFNSDHYISSHNSSNIIVKEKLLNTKISATYNVRNRDVVITALVRDENDNLVSEGGVVFNINGEKTTVEVNNGIAVLNTAVNRISVVYISFDGDGYYPSSTSIRVEAAEKIPSKIALTDMEVTVGETAVIVANVFDENNNLINEGSVTFLANSKSTVVNVKKGVASLITSFDNSGTYAVICSFESTNYRSANASSKVTVSKISINADLKIDYDGKVLVNVTSDTAFKGKLEINNKVYLLDIEKGTSAFDVPVILDNGIYSAVLTYDGDSKYYPLSVSDSFNAVNKKASIVSNDISMYYKDGTRFGVRLVDSNNRALDNKKITFTLNGIDYTRTTDSNGYSSLAINLEAGKYQVDVKYREGSDLASASNFIEVKSTILSGNVTKYYRNDTQFYATILDEKGNTAADVIVNININGVFYDRTTNDMGVMKLNLNLEPGTYILTLVNPINGERASAKVVILPIIVENYDLTKYYRNSSQYSVKVLSKTGNPVVGKNVIFNINGVFYQRATDSNGVARLSINLNPETYIITAEYDGYRVSNKIEVLNILKTDDLTKKYGADSPFRVTLLDGTGKFYSNQIITFNINGIFYKRTTDNNGVALLNINLQRGVYIITSSYNGLDVSNTVTVY